MEVPKGLTPLYDPHERAAERTRRSVKERKEGRFTKGVELVGQGIRDEAVRMATIPKRMVEASMYDAATGERTLADLGGELTGTAALNMFGPKGRPGVVSSGPWPQRAYHGSPHDFDRFDLSRVGTGEGAQAYGHGLYFAENPLVAMEYRNKLSGNKGVSSVDLATDMMNNYKGDRDAAIKALQMRLKSAEKLLDSPITAKFYSPNSNIPEAIKLLEQNAPLKGRMYEVDLNIHPERMLDWDKKLGEQSGKVIDATRSHLDQQKIVQLEARKKMLERGTDIMGRPFTPDQLKKLREEIGPIEELSGEQVYKRVGLPALNREEGYRTSTERLREGGVQGIRFLDQLSRSQSSKPKTSNFVIFDDKLVDIRRKYSKTGDSAIPQGLTPIDTPRGLTPIDEEK